MKCQLSSSIRQFWSTPIENLEHEYEKHFIYLIETNSTQKVHFYLKRSPTWFICSPQEVAHPLLVVDPSVNYSCTLQDVNCLLRWGLFTLQCTTMHLDLHRDLHLHQGHLFAFVHFSSLPETPSSQKPQKSSKFPPNFHQDNYLLTSMFPRCQHQWPRSTSRGRPHLSPDSPAEILMRLMLELKYL